MKQCCLFEITLLLAVSFYCTSLITEEKEIKVDKYVAKIISGRVSKTITSGEYSEKSSIYFQYFKLEDKSPKYLKTVNELISKTVNSDFEETEKQKITANLSKKYFEDILVTLKKSFYDAEAIFPWSIMDSIRIDNSKSQFTHLETYTYSFTGGAHGNGFESHFLIDKVSGEKLTISSVFNNLKKLNSLVDAYFRKSNNLSPSDNLQDAGWFIDNQLKATNNFFFRDKKVVFVYNTYEIAPYSMGVTQVKIPLSRLENILKIKLN
jgi:hypothetical protein